ncbi:MAG: hypothetical protein LBG16_03010 [Elusimicrobiota bacterium]|jgi:hypothetical protein|nr:hypothetical protein [Elusimicrobiota bacterium]MDR0734651.1 hypothetical protein [Elusimicrobiota bacterium]
MKNIKYVFTLLICLSFTACAASRGSSYLSSAAKAQKQIAARNLGRQATKDAVESYWGAPAFASQTPQGTRAEYEYVKVSESPLKVIPILGFAFSDNYSYKRNLLVYDYDTSDNVIDYAIISDGGAYPPKI